MLLCRRSVEWMVAEADSGTKIFCFRKLNRVTYSVLKERLKAGMGIIPAFLLLPLAQKGGQKVDKTGNDGTAGGQVIEK
jgi:hypothetical protein